MTTMIIDQKEKMVVILMKMIYISGFEDINCLNCLWFNRDFGKSG